MTLSTIIIGTIQICGMALFTFIGEMPLIAHCGKKQNSFKGGAVAAFLLGYISIYFKNPIIRNLFSAGLSIVGFNGEGFVTDYRSLFIFSKHFIRCFNDVSYAYIIIDNNFYSTKRNFSYPFISKKEKNRKEDCKMKKLIPLFLMLCCLVSVTACSKDEIVSNYNQALQSIGDKGLTDDKDLQGKREFGIDSYVGNYTADYDDFSGNEIIFGNSS